MKVQEPAASPSRTAIRAPEAKGRPHLAYLDGIRGGAALWVLIAHCMIWGGWYWSHFPDPKIAVDIFMILSGYLMACQFSSSDNIPSRRTVAAFYVRRFFRIAPAYYLSLLIAFTLGGSFLSGYLTLREANLGRWADDMVYDPARIHYTAQNLFLHASFLFGLMPRSSFSTMLPDWSIGLEVQFYAVFPLLIYFVRRYKYALPVVALVAVSDVTIAAFDRLPDPVSGTMGLFPEPSFLLLKLPLFLVGILVADAVSDLGTNPRRSACLGVFCLLVASPFSTYVRVVAVILFYLGVSPASTSNHVGGPRTPRLSHLLGRALGNSLTRFMADTSYCVYLFHGFFISACGSMLYRNDRFLRLADQERVLIVVLIVVLCSYGLAVAVYRTVELPGIRLGRRVIGRWLTPRDGTPLGNGPTRRRAGGHIAANPAKDAAAGATRSASQRLPDRQHALSVRR